MKTTVGVLAAWLVAAGLAVGYAQAAQAVDKPSLEDALKKLPSYKFGESRLALTAIEDAVRDSYKNPDQRKELAKTLCAVLTSAEATTDAKGFVCRQLSIIGTDEQVPTLAPLLTDKDMSNMARYALERIPTDAALAAIRDALPKATGTVKIGIINSLGERRDAKSADELAKLVADSDPAIAAAAAAALGKIGGEQAVAALAGAVGKGPAALQATVANAYLQCADQLVAAGKKDQAVAIYQKMYAPTEPKRFRIAALQGLVNAQGEQAAPLVIEALTGQDKAMQAVAAHHVRQIAGKELTATFADQVSKLPPPAQVLLLDALGGRGDAAALPAITAALKSDNLDVRVAAVEAIGKLGNASCAGELAKLAASGEKRQADAARTSLDQLRGEGVDDALVAALKDAAPAVKVEILRSLSARKAVSAVPAILAAAGEGDKKVQIEAVKALGVLGDEKAVPEMVKCLVACKDNEVRSNLESALAQACGRVTDAKARTAAVLAALDGAEPPAKASLLMVLGRIGDPGSQSAIAACLKDANKDVQDAAIRALSNWPDAGVAAELLGIAKSSGNMTHRVLALRGYVRLVALPNTRKADETIKMFEDAMAAAPRPDEKKLVLAAVSNEKSAQAVGMLTKYLDEPTLATEAAVGLIKMASDKNVKSRCAKELKAAKDKILQVITDKRILDQTKNM